MDRSTFLWGLLSGIIGSAIVALAGALLPRAARPLLKRLNTPGPVTLTEKLRIAEELKGLQESMIRLEHMASHPKDLYLYLHQVGLVAVLCFAGGLYCLPFASFGQDKANVQGLLALLLPIIGLVFGLAGIVEATTLSEKHINETRSKLQARIDEAVSKIGPIAAQTLDPKDKDAPN